MSEQPPSMSLKEIYCYKKALKNFLCAPGDHTTEDLKKVLNELYRWDIVCRELKTKHYYNTEQMNETTFISAHTINRIISNHNNK